MHTWISPHCHHSSLDVNTQDCHLQIQKKKDFRVVFLHLLWICLPVFMGFIFTFSYCFPSPIPSFWLGKLTLVIKEDAKQKPVKLPTQLCANKLIGKIENVCS